MESVRCLGDYDLELTFADGVTGRIDFAPWVMGRGGVFAPLENMTYFARVTVNAEIGTIVWPNGVDFEPEVLYAHVSGKPIPGNMSALAGRKN